MNEIRHQAMIELQKLVLAAENKMIELVATERTKMSGNCRSSAAAASLQISPSLISQYNVSRVRFVGLKSVCSEETTMCYQLVITTLIIFIASLSCQVVSEKNSIRNTFEVLFPKVFWITVRLKYLLKVFCCCKNLLSIYNNFIFLKFFKILYKFVSIQVMNNFNYIVLFKTVKLNNNMLALNSNFPEEK